MKVTTQKIEKVEVEIKVPSFYKDSSYSVVAKLFGIVDEKTGLTVVESRDRTSVSNDNLDLCERELNQIAQGELEEISEEEFMTAYNRALHSMSLTPELVVK